MKFTAVCFVLVLTTAAFAIDRQVTKVLVLPFAPLGDGQSYEWIGPAVQQGMLAELSRLQDVSAAVPATVPDTPIMDRDAALEIARQQQADLVIFGSYQVVEQNLRITGQVFDVQENESATGLKASGTVRDLFALQDTLAAQARRALAPAEAIPAAERQPATQPLVRYSGPVEIRYGKPPSHSDRRETPRSYYYYPLPERSPYLDRYDRYYYGRDFGGYYYHHPYDRYPLYRYPYYSYPPPVFIVPPRHHPFRRE